MRFKLDIHSSNDEMRLREHVASALKSVAEKITDSPVEHTIQGSIRDVNGNRVGHWYYYPEKKT